MTDVIERLSSELRGRYAIQKELGAGGMATVYLAEDVKHRTWRRSRPGRRKVSGRCWIGFTS